MCTGWWLALADGREGWVPASYLTLGTAINHSESFEWATTNVGKATVGSKYITMTAFNAQIETDISFPECVVVDVVNRSLTGWWKIRLTVVASYPGHSQFINVTCKRGVACIRGYLC